MEQEEWRPHPSLPNIEVSSAGMVRGPRGIKARSGGSRGRLKVAIWIDGRTTTRDVHVLVCETFHGPRPANHEAAHINGQQLDNRAENVEWRLAKNTSGNSQLTWEDVDAIRRMRKGGAKQKEIANKFGVTQSHICAILINGPRPGGPL